MKYSFHQLIWMIFVVTFSQSAWAETIKVPNDYFTIQRAIDAAQAGDTVLVAPGRYNEQLVMKEGIILKSDPVDSGDDLVDGPGQKKVLRRAQRTIIDGTGYPDFTDAQPMVEFPAGITRATVLDGFTITKMPEVDHTLPGHAHTLQCRGSSPVIRNNIIIDNGSSGIGSHARFKEGENLSPEEKFSFENIADHAHPLIENNVSAENIGAGIGNNHYSYATVVNNEVFGNISEHDHPAPGIGIQHGAHPLVVGNLVYDNDWTGIGCRKGAQPVNRRTNPIIRDNTVMNNGRAGVAEHGAGIGADGTGYVDDPMTIENNVVYGNLAAGIGMRNGAFVVAIGNISYENDMAGIGVDSSTALVRDNTVYLNVRAGVGCRGGEVTIENNDIHENNMTGIGLDKAKATVIVGNWIHDNGSSGFLSEIKDIFSFSPRSGTGVGMRGSEVLVFSNNTVYNNAVPGLAVTQGSRISAGENNLIEKNGEDWAPNLAVLNNSRVTLSDTTIQDGNPLNVFMSGSQLILNNCRIENASRPGIVAEKSTLKIDGGSVADNGAIGILMRGSSGDIKNVLISGNEHHGIMAKDGSSIRVENCTVENNSGHGGGGAGISIDEAEAYLVSNLIQYNESVGVEVSDGSLTLWDNVLADQVQGVYIEGESALDARNNIFSNNRAEGLEIGRSVRIKQLDNNKFWNNGGSSGRRPSLLNFLPRPSEEEERYPGESAHDWEELEYEEYVEDLQGRVL
jgi:parallel beta-helix repeat protein